MTPRRCAALWAAGLMLVLPSAPQAAEQRLLMAPHLTDTRLPEAEAPHLVIYDADKRDAPLLVWLGGTGGKPAAGPQRLYETALRQGYRLPPALWHASFHTLEPQAAAMAQIYRELGIPPAQVHALSEPVMGAHPHGEGISNPAYRALWEQMLKPVP